MRPLVRGFLIAVLLCAITFICIVWKNDSDEEWSQPTVTTTIYKGEQNNNWDVANDRAVEGSVSDLEIDLVYTWVDENDPEYQKEQEKWLKADTNPPPLPTSTLEESFQKAMTIHRLKDNSELKYSLRSVEMFAPWFRHIWIVTNGQVPQWLNTSHPKVSIVTHTQIFAESKDLPTFNPHAVEMHLYRIPGLARRFVYMNDDMMFGSKVAPEDFWTQLNGHKVFLKFREALDPFHNTSTFKNIRWWSYYNSHEQLSRLFGRYDPRKLISNRPHYFHKDIFGEVIRAFPEAWTITAKQRFQSKLDMDLPFAYYHWLINVRQQRQSDKTAFDMLDTDHDGLLSDVELATLVKKLEFTTDKKVVAEYKKRILEDNRQVSFQALQESSSYLETLSHAYKKKYNYECVVTDPDDSLSIHSKLLWIDNLNPKFISLSDENNISDARPCTDCAKQIDTVLHNFYEYYYPKPSCFEKAL